MRDLPAMFTNLRHRQTPFRNEQRRNKISHPFSICRGTTLAIPRHTKNKM